MSRAIKDSIKKLKDWVFLNQSRMKMIAEGQGTQGTRAAPTQAGTNDTKIGTRLDNGETIFKDGKEYKRYKLQVNKDAENSTLKQLANQDSHKVWSETDIPIGEGESSAKEVLEQMFEELEANLKD